MAIDLFSDSPTNNTTTSPRISFSYDLTQNDTVPVEHLLRSFSSSSSNVDFNFCVHQNPENHHASMADELFSDGKMLPTQVNPKLKTQTLKPSPVTQPPPPPSTRRRIDKPALVDDEEMKRHDTKSFWGFKRSSSCGNGYARSLCPITLLSRSHSTGSSTTSSKRSPSLSSSSSKDVFSQKQQNRSFQKGTGSQKPPLRKGGYGYGNNNSNNNGAVVNNGIRVNPVLNLGFGSFFSSKNKNKK